MNSQEQRDRDVFALSAELACSMPPIPGGAQSYVIVVEERQEFLAEAFPYIALMTPGEVPVGAVGVSAALGPDLQHVFCAGVGSDVQKMEQVADWILQGRLSSRTALLVPPHRALLLNGFLRKALRARGLACETQAMDTPQKNGVVLQGAIRQARLVIKAMNAGVIDTIPSLTPGAEPRQAYERLVHNV